MLRSVFLTLVATVALALSASAAVNPRTDAGAQSVAINGTASAEATGWSGGAVSGTVVETTSTSLTVKKHVAQIGYEPVVITATPPLSPQLTACLANLCSGNSSSVTLDLVGDGTSFQATGAELIEARFPEFNAANNTPYEITFVFRISTVREQSGSTRNPAPVGRAIRATTSQFRLTLGNIDTNRVTSIGAFSIARGNPADPLSSARDAVPTTSSVKVSNLSVLISSSGATSWSAWKDDFLVRGNSGDAKELSGLLTLLGPDLQTPLLSLQLSNVGIYRYGIAENDGSAAIPRMQAGLYCEKISIPTPSPNSPQPTSAQPASPATPAVSTPVTPVRTISPIKPVSSPNDTGLRDPSGFPRPPGLTRTSYTKADYESQLTETANYSTPLDLDALLESYLKLLAQEGWKREGINESGTSAENRMLLTNWRKDKVQADLRLYGAPKGSNVSLSITTTK